MSRRPTTPPPVPGDGPDGSDGIDRPTQCDWAWRPAPWAAPMAIDRWRDPPSRTRIADGVRVFHDGPGATLALSQAPASGASHELAIEVGAFEGAYLSLAIDLPRAGLAGLGAGRILLVTATFGAAPPHAAFARLNLGRSGEAQSVTAPFLSEGAGSDVRVAALDMVPAVPGRDPGAGWLDLIFERPARSAISILDLTLARRPYAAF